MTTLRTLSSRSGLERHRRWRRPSPPSPRRGSAAQWVMRSAAWWKTVSVPATSGASGARRGCRRRRASRGRWQRRGEVGQPAADHVVDDDDLAASPSALVEEQVDDVRADEAGAAGHEHALAARTSRSIMLSSIRVQPLGRGGDDRRPAASRRSARDTAAATAPRRRRARRAGSRRARSRARRRPAAGAPGRVVDAGRHAACCEVGCAARRAVGVRIA